MLDAVKSAWRSWNLARQFITCASLVLLPAMLSIGAWVSDRIQAGVTSGAGINAALYMENFVEPLVQDLAEGKEISAHNQVRLAKLLEETLLGQKVTTFKIWGRGGIVLASNRSDVVGMRYPPSERLRRAWAGIVATSFDLKGDAENEVERRGRQPILEVYIPLRARGTASVIAVGEFYERAEELSQDLERARSRSWLVVAAVTFSMIMALFGIVRHGSQTIERQHSALEQRVDQLTDLLAENDRLRKRANEASARAAETSEHYLRRLGSDLHDGPAQLISLALLRLEENAAASTAKGTTFPVRDVLLDALKDIRNLAAGLALPEIEDLSLAAAVRMAVQRHEALTRSTVALKLTELPDAVPQSIKLCVYRFIQEGLTNSFKHAKSASSGVEVGMQGGFIRAAVSDTGVGLDAGHAATSGRLGLKGLIDRVESLGGEVEITSVPGGGTLIAALLPTTAGAMHHA